jgi:hypothetical protein
VSKVKLFSPEVEYGVLCGKCFEEKREGVFFLAYDQPLTLNRRTTPMGQLNFAARSNPTGLRREIKRTYGLQPDELSRMRPKHLMEQAMHEDVPERVQTEPFKRVPGRTDRSNRTYSRSFLARCGLIELRVPRTRATESSFEIIHRAYVQREPRLDNLITWTKQSTWPTGLGRHSHLVRRRYLRLGGKDLALVREHGLFGVAQLIPRKRK